MGKKSKASSKKKKDKEVKDTLPEVDKEYYEIQIADLTKKLTRLRTYSSQLENENDDLKKELEELDIDRADVIALLKRHLFDKTSIIKELVQRAKALQEAKDLEKKHLQEQIQDKDDHYKKICEQQASEIKLLHGKINSLEEFKLAREDLMKKFENQNQKCSEQEITHNRQMYELQKKFILDKDNLRKEIEERLLKLSLDFQKATELRIASSTQNVLKENIALNNELTYLIESYEKIFKANDALENKNKKLALELQIAENMKNKTMKRNLTQSQVIEKLTYEHKKVLDCYTELDQYKNMVLVLNEKLAKANNVSEKADVKSTNIMQQYHELQTRLNEQIAQNNEIMRTNRELDDKIKKLDDEKRRGILDDNTEYSQRQSLLTSVLKLLSCEDFTITPFEEDQTSLETIVSFGHRYEVGDLGIIGDSNIKRDQKNAGRQSRISSSSFPM